MPRDVSSSSSEDETDSVPTEPQKGKQTESDDVVFGSTEKKSTRYQCPADFVSFCHKPCSSTLTKSLKNNKNELWLIKAPASFNPECFSSIKLPLSGLHTLKTPSAADGTKSGSNQQIYSILASSHGTSELHLLTSDKQSSNGVVLGPAFSGLLNVCESYGDSSANLAPQVIPAAPAPSIPPGLKQRFQPFGSKTPTLTCVAEDEVKGAVCGPSSANLRPLVVKRFIEDTGNEEEERKKKKKRNKKKWIETEQAEVPEVKVEPKAEILNEALTELPLQECEISEERRKKKKKKKDRDREEVNEVVEPSVKVKAEEVMVKCEPIDTTYGDEVEGLGKMKKKKKKSKTHDE